MIYPSARSVALVVAGAPVALLVAVLLPAFWYLGLGWVLAVLAATLADGMRVARAAAVTVRLEAPGQASVGALVPIVTHLAFVGGQLPGSVEVALAPSPLLAPGDARGRAAMAGGVGSVALDLIARRRGLAGIERVWLRWPGRLGLAWVQRTIVPDRPIRITPDIAAVHRAAASLFRRDALQGLLARLDRGDGSEFEAISEFRPGMDKRSIAWKPSARHGRLMAREHRVERNNDIVFAIDAGRAMCEPVAGMPRLDRAVSAALLSAYVALKLGDRVGLFGFDARPRLSSGTVAGVRSFGALQRLAASLDYSTSETNYTLALTTLDARLARRSMVVVFTEFTDAASAELMLRAIERMRARHLLVFVMLGDVELEEIAAAEPIDAAAVARAATAADLLRERQLVIARLSHAGATVIEARHDRLALALVEHYLAVKRRSLL